MERCRSQEARRRRDRGGRTRLGADQGADRTARAARPVHAGAPSLPLSPAPARGPGRTHGFSAHSSRWMAPHRHTTEPAPARAPARPIPDAHGPAVLVSSRPGPLPAGPGRGRVMTSTRLRARWAAPGRGTDFARLPVPGPDRRCNQTPSRGKFTSVCSCFKCPIPGAAPRPGSLRGPLPWPPPPASASPCSSGQPSWAGPKHGCGRLSPAEPALVNREYSGILGFDVPETAASLAPAPASGLRPGASRQGQAPLRRGPDGRLSE